MCQSLDRVPLPCHHISLTVRLFLLLVSEQLTFSGVGSLTTTPNHTAIPWGRFSVWIFSHSWLVPIITSGIRFFALHLRHCSFSNPSLALPTSQLILQPFRCFTYDTVHSPTLLSLLLPHRIFTYVSWRAAHGPFQWFFHFGEEIAITLNHIG